MPQDNWHFIKHFLKYKKEAVGAHGLHSPFVYKLYTEYIQKKRKHIRPEIEELRRASKASNLEIEVTDFKSGKKKKKKLGFEAKSSPSTTSFSAFLSKFLDYLNAECILETGTSLGFNALYLAESNVHRVWTLEGNSSIANIAMEHFKQLNAEKISLVSGDIHDTFAPTLRESGADVIFLDADHRSQAVSKFLNMMTPYMSGIKCIIIHDIYWSEDMTRIWQKLIEDQRFPMTIDIFQAGLIFPNENLEKQHFVVKF